MLLPRAISTSLAEIQLSILDVTTPATVTSSSFVTALTMPPPPVVRRAIRVPPILADSCPRRRTPLAALPRVSRLSSTRRQPYRPAVPLSIQAARQTLSYVLSRVIWILHPISAPIMSNLSSPNSTDIILM